MQDAHRIWVGLAIAIIVAGVLAVSEVREREDLPWFEPDFEGELPPEPGTAGADTVWSATESPDDRLIEERIIDIPFAGSVPQEFEAGRRAPDAPASLSKPPAPEDRAPTLALVATPEELGGSLEIDGQGHFRPTPEARERFDSFFADSSLTIARGRLNLHLLDELEPRAADEAMAVVDRYVALLGAEAALRRRGELDPARQEALRKEVLGSELSAALFGTPLDAH